MTKKRNKQNKTDVKKRCRFMRSLTDSKISTENKYPGKHYISE